MTALASIDAAQLSVEDLTVRFGGLLAVDGASFEGAPGVVTGLIGPNGAGKTTIINACTGFVPIERGTVRLAERDLGRRTPAARAQAGLGRTFQRMALVEAMTVRENVALGLESRLSAGLWGQLLTTRRERAFLETTTADAIARCHLDDISDRLVGELSTGQRRLVELARALAGRFRFLLLDEPSSGLDEAETEQFGRILLDVVRRDGTGMLLVEHDMTLVRAVCTYIYVLEFGRIVFSGPTEEALAAPVVQAAYLGSEEVA